MTGDMHALRLHRRGGPEELVYERAPVPVPGIGDVLLRVEAAGLTPTELEWPSTWVDRRGLDRTPVIPSHEVCGVVVELGYGAAGFAVGDEVFGLTDWYRDGAAAEFVAVEARNLASRPHGCSAAEAASLPLAGLTAWQALFEHGRLTAGETVAVTGATGGVGALALQLAAAAGAAVVAVGRGDKTEAAARLGAQRYVDSNREDVLDEIGRVDLLFDLVGGELLVRLNGAGLAARVVSVVEPRDGVDFFVVEADGRTLAELAARVDAGELRPVVAETVPLEDGASAFAPRQRGPGKRVLAVPPR